MSILWVVFVMLSHSVVSDSATPWTVARQAPLSMEFSRQEYWSGLSLPSPGELHDPGTEHRSPALQADSLPTEPLRKPLNISMAIPKLEFILQLA